MTTPTLGPERSGVDQVVGRDAELGAIEGFLDGVVEGPTALVVDGEAGIGKTTIWAAAVRAAEARGLRVLQARPAESEAKLSYAALADLVGMVFPDTRAALPAVPASLYHCPGKIRRAGRTPISPSW